MRSIHHGDGPAEQERREAVELSRVRVKTTRKSWNLFAINKVGMMMMMMELVCGTWMNLGSHLSPAKKNFHARHLLSVIHLDQTAVRNIHGLPALRYL